MSAEPVGGGPLPCPFCGAVGLDFCEGSTFRWLAYSCVGCGMGDETRMQTMGEGTQEEWRKAAEADAVLDWNRRAPAAPEAPAAAQSDNKEPPRGSMREP